MKSLRIHPKHLFGLTLVVLTSLLLTLCPFWELEGSALNAPSKKSIPSISSQAIQTIIDLSGISLTANTTNANGLNDSGQVVGVSPTSQYAEYHAFLYSNGQMTDLGRLACCRSEALAINASGQIVGETYVANGEKHAFLYSNGQMIDLGTLGGTRSIAASINDLGQVVGSSWVYGFTARAFLYQNGQMMNLGTLDIPGLDNQSNAHDINNAGQIVGESRGSGGGLGFLYSNGQMRSIGTLGGRGSVAHAINDLGQVVGESKTANGSDHAFLYQNGQMTDLGTLGGSFSLALDINNAGQIVGRSPTASGEYYFIYDSVNGMRNLNDLLPPNSGWILTSARNDLRINNAGQISGTGLHLIVRPGYQNWETRAFLMTLGPPNTPPTLVGQTITRQQGTTGTVSTIAIVGDDLTPVGSLSVAVTSVPTGITVGPLTNINGTITANVTAACNAAIGNNTVGLQVTDGGGLTSTTNLTVNVVANAAPAVTIASPASGAIYAVGTPVTFTGSFTDNPGGTHTANWTFDTITQSGTVNETTGAVTGAYPFAAAGVYLGTLTVNDGCGGTGTANAVGGLTAMVVIYDPNGGFVTGGGWINSPAGAYTADPALFGKASFGFVSKYQPGATVPTGNTEFQFRVANFNFKSTSYDWLVVAGARAQYKGTGTVNSSGDYGFMLTAIDGQINGGGGTDKFRIKIWDKGTGNIVYDNQVGAADGAAPSTVLGGGSIVIHKP